jgi:ATP-dependent Clp protease ATP-binding subunit ClpC
MLFESVEPINVLTCPSCKGTGLRGFNRCSVCKGNSMIQWKRNKILQWTTPLIRQNIALLNGRRIWNKIRRITLIVLWLNCWIWSGFLAYRDDVLLKISNTPELIFVIFDSLPSLVKLLFWLGIIILLYFWHRVISEKQRVVLVEKYDYEIDLSEQKTSLGDLSMLDWGALASQKAKRISINKVYTDEAMSALFEAYNYADKNNFAQVEAEHLFFALLGFNRISNLFLRMGIPAKILQSNVSLLFDAPSQTQNKNSMPLISNNVMQIIFRAYEEAYQAHQDYVMATELLAACIKQSPVLQEVLYDLNIDKDKLVNVIEWARIRERLYRQYKKQSAKASRRSKHGMDKAMTALATQYLNKFSEDMTLKAQFGHYDFCVAREKEFEEIFRIVGGGATNIVLVGDHGVGKKSIMEGLAEKIISDDVPAKLSDKRFVKLNISALLAGTTAAGAIERLIIIMNEIARARNVILFIQNIHELVGVSAGEEGSLDLAGTLAEYLSAGRFMVFTTTTSEHFARHIQNTSLANIVQRIDVNEMDENQAIQVLESKIAYIEHKSSVFFSYDAVEKCVKLASRYLHETFLPGSALEIAREAAVYTRTKRGDNSLVTGEEVGLVIAEKTGIPATSVSSDESDKLLRLEEEMHKRVVGQNEAVDLIANALRRARVEIRAKNRPIANFLFLGPTGVGKTELAKTISQVYFGGEDRMIRLDMSEYQDKTGIYRLIGAPGEQGTGILTEAIRRHPFTLLLLDEIEKADPDILNIFLQVMDDGRLTDSTGKVVDFTNCIIIATSNAGTQYVQDQMKAGLSSEQIKERLLHGELRDYFKPEFLNRFDGIVLFKALSREDIKKIAAIMLKRVAADLDQKGIELIVEDGALEFLAEVGYDPEFGARPMRRALQEKIENKLAEMILSGTIKRRDKVIVGDNGSMTTTF